LIREFNISINLKEISVQTIYLNKFKEESLMITFYKVYVNGFLI
jgi:hypothetical protein